MKLFLLPLMLFFISCSSMAKKGELPVIELTTKNTVVFNQPFTAKYISKKIVEMSLMQFKLRSDEPIYLVLNTPGGSVGAGNLFVDFINGLSNPVHTITIFAASMGYNTVQNLGNRYILPSGVLMSHRAYIKGLSGQIRGEANSRLDYLTSKIVEMEERAAKRISMPLKEYQDRVDNEIWVTGKHAVETKHADQMVLIRCSKALIKKQTKEEFATIFGSVYVEFSGCPLITQPKQIESRNRKVRRYIKNFYTDMKKHVHRTHLWAK